MILISQIKHLKELFESQKTKMGTDISFSLIIPSMYKLWRRLKSSNFKSNENIQDNIVNEDKSVSLSGIIKDSFSLSRKIKTIKIKATKLFSILENEISEYETTNSEISNNEPFKEFKNLILYLKGFK